MIKYKIQSAQFENVWLEAEDKDGDFVELTIMDTFNESKIIVETVELLALLDIVQKNKPTFWQKVVAYASMCILRPKIEKAWKNPEIKIKVKVPQGTEVS